VYRQIYGHEVPIGLLKNAVSTGKSAHAFIFSGPDGIGKRTVALAFAASLLCPEGSSSGEGCGECSSCQRIAHGNHPDLLLIAPKGAMIRIQDIRDLIHVTTIHPLEDRGRVILIDQADRMNDQAANALLKTLEEPRPKNALILITARAYQLPITIQSRCQRVVFSPLSKNDLTRYLVEQRGLTSATASALADWAEGSVSRALHLSRREYLSLREQVVSHLKEGIVGHRLPLALSTLLSADKEMVEDQLDMICSLFRDALWLKETGKTEGLMNGDYVDVVGLLAHQLDASALLDNIRLLMGATLSLEQNVNRSLTLDATLFRLRAPG